MLTLQITIESSEDGNYFQVSPGFDATTATELECDVFGSILERIAPGINFDDDLDSQMAFLSDSLCGLHDKSNEDFSGPEQELSA